MKPENKRWNCRKDTSLDFQRKDKTKNRESREKQMFDGRKWVEHREGYSPDYLYMLKES